MMRIYLDNCCFNRPFDSQLQTRVQLETLAKLRIQDRVAAGELELVWSYILDYENAANPFQERREAIEAWRSYASVDIVATPELVQEAQKLVERGIRSKDALHVASAVAAGCDYFISTDDRLLKKLSGYTGVIGVDPTAFVRNTEP